LEGAYAFFESCKQLVGEAGQTELKQARQRLLKAIT
jgi:exonuclease VII small subunit